MFSINDLCANIENTINTTSGLSLVQNKVFYDFIPPSTARPYCRYSIVTDSLNQFYGNKSLDTVQVQFSFFCDNRTDAGNLVKALGETFHGVTLPMTTGTNVSCRRMPGVRITQEGTTSSGYVFHGLVVIEFRINC